MSLQGSSVLPVKFVLVSTDLLQTSKEERKEAQLYAVDLAADFDLFITVWYLADVNVQCKAHGRHSRASPKCLLATQDSFAATELTH